jgi:serine/threonine protein kinase/tetratricopeptide (TPR) repeat protein
LAEFTPRIYGKYYLIDRIAVGGMAEVYAAKSFSEGGFEKMLVIKRILSRYSENRSFVSMFIDEAKISVALQHANVVQVYDFGKIKDNYYLAMEWVDGRDLKRLSRCLKERRESLPQDFAVYIAHEICKGLDYAHKLRDYKGAPMGIVHQDISPSNVVVSFSGEIKVVDFGIAKTQALANDVKDGINWGKVQYSAPERLRNQEPTPQSDIFSVGVVLHELLTGRGLFRDRDPKASARRILSGDYPAPSIYNPAIPPGLDLLVMRALSLKGEDRFTDAGELQEMLFEFLSKSPAAVQRSLSAYMVDVFTEERREQQDRLERGSRMALDFHESLGEMSGLEMGPSGSVPIGSGLLDSIGVNPRLHPSKGRNIKDLRGTPNSVGGTPSNDTLQVEDLSEPISEVLHVEETRDVPSTPTHNTYNTYNTANSSAPNASPKRKRAAHVHGVRKRRGAEPDAPPPNRRVWGVAIALGLAVGLVGGLVALNGGEDPLPAAEVVRNLEEAHPDVTGQQNLRISDGWLQVRKGSVEALGTARNAFEGAVAGDPHSVGALAGLALVYAQLSERLPDLGQRSLPLLARAEAIDPTNPDILRARAGAQVAFGRPEEAKETARACLAARSDDALCQLFLGQALLALNELDEAEGVLTSAQEVLTESGAAHRSLASVWTRQGRLAEARDLLEGFPGRGANPQVDADLAELYARAGSYDRAFELVSSAVEDDPRALRARLLLSELMLHVRGQTNDADALLANLSEEPVGDPELQLRILVQAANAALAAGDPARAERLAEEAVKVRFGWPAAHYVQARARAANGDRSGAIEALTHVDLEGIPDRDVVRYHYGAAMLLIADQRLRIARLELEAALELEPGFWWARVALAEVLRGLDQPDDAGFLLEEGWRHDIEQDSVRDQRVQLVIEAPDFTGHPGADCLLNPSCTAVEGVSPPWAGRIALARGQYGEAVGLLPDEGGFVGGLRGLALGGGVDGDWAGLHRRYAIDLGSSDPEARARAAGRALALDPADTGAAAVLLGLPTR